MVRSFRNALSAELAAAVENDNKIMVLTPDLARAVRIESFAEKYPNNFVTGGISEANIIGVAAGMASAGLKPIIVGFSMFVAERPFEQIRNIISYPCFDVKIIATHCGLCVGKDGATHQALEDIALMNTLPNMAVYSASDVSQMNSLVQQMLTKKGPAYLRLGRDIAEDIYEEDYVCPSAGGDLIRNGKDAVIFTTGLTALTAMKAAEKLEAGGVDVAIVNIFRLKPFPKELVVEYLGKCGCAVTVEDHQRSGGLGSLVCETAADSCPVPVERVGADGVFGGSGNQDELYLKYGINACAVKEAVMNAITRRK